MDPTRDEIQLRELAVAVVEQASPLERQILLNWAQQLVAIRDSNLTATEKAKASISAIVESKAIWPFLNMLGRELKRLGWDERSLPARVGLGAAAFALLLPGKGAAGIAALGGAIGVPLWVVFGAGGAFVGVIIQEINKQPPPTSPNPPQEPLFMAVAHLAVRCDRHANIGVVMGATAPNEAAAVRAAFPKLPFLLPGIGRQGGDVEAAVRASFTGDRASCLAAVVGAIMYADDPRGTAIAWRDRMRRAAEHAPSEK